MKTSYHITPNGPLLCEASVRACHYGSHFDNLNDANAHYAETMRETFGEFAKISKSYTQKRRENLYRAREKFIATTKAVKASPAAQKTVKTLKTARSGAESVALASMYGAEAVKNTTETAVIGALVAKDALKHFPRKTQAYASQRGSAILRAASKKIQETPAQIAAKKQALDENAKKERERMIGYVREISNETKNRIREYRNNLKKLTQQAIQKNEEQNSRTAKRKARTADSARNLAEVARHNKAKLRSSYREEIGKTYGGKLKARFASDLQTGDYLTNGLRVMQVSNVEGTSRVTLMDPQSGISRTDIVSADSPVASVRPRRQFARSLKNRASSAYANALTRGHRGVKAGIARSSAWATLQRDRGRKAWTETRNRVRVAAAHQRNALDALRGIDRAVIARQQEPARASEIGNVSSIHHLRKVA